MRLLLPAILSPGAGCMLVSQNAEYAAAHFGILKLAWVHFMKSDPFDSGSRDKNNVFPCKPYLLPVNSQMPDNLEYRTTCWRFYR